jgi:hypothetical protein
VPVERGDLRIVLQPDQHVLHDIAVAGNLPEIEKVLFSRILKDQALCCNTKTQFQSLQEIVWGSIRPVTLKHFWKIGPAFMKRGSYAAEKHRGGGVPP